MAREPASRKDRIKPGRKFTRQGTTMGTTWAIRTPEERRQYGRNFYQPVTTTNHATECAALRSLPCDCMSP